MKKQDVLRDVNSYEDTTVSKKFLEKLIEDIPEVLLDIPQTSYDEVHDCLFRELEMYARELTGESPTSEYVILPLVTYLMEKNASLDMGSQSIKKNS